MEWSQVLSIDPIFLNLGGGTNCHPNPIYEHYVSVDLNPTEGWSVRHDLRTHIPLPDESVERILSEDFMEHLKVHEIRQLLAECFRLLKSGGIMRIGVPDYNNPKDRPFLEKGTDPRLPLHTTLTQYELMNDIIEQCPFSRYEFYYYWNEGRFFRKNIDYSYGFIKRTPDNDPRNRRRGVKQRSIGLLQDFLYQISRGFHVSEDEWKVRPGHPFHITSLVVDLFKE